MWEDWKAMHPEWKPQPWAIKEEIGEVIINDYAINRIIVNDNKE
jgi:hypothetical protein